MISLQETFALFEMFYTKLWFKKKKKKLCNKILTNENRMYNSIYSLSVRVIVNTLKVHFFTQNDNFVWFIYWNWNWTASLYHWNILDVFFFIIFLYFSLRYSLSLPLVYVGSLLDFIIKLFFNIKLGHMYL